MTDEDFLLEYNGASCTEDDLAYRATYVNDSDLGMIAKDFLEARAAFLNYLDDIGYEWG